MTAMFYPWVVLDARRAAVTRALGDSGQCLFDTGPGGSNQPRRDGEGARSSVGTRRRNQKGSRASRSPLKHAGRALSFF